MFSLWWQGYNNQETKDQMVTGKADIQAYGKSLGGTAAHKQRYWDVVADMPYVTDPDIIEAEFIKRSKANTVGLSGKFTGARLMSPQKNKIYGSKQLLWAVNALANPEGSALKNYDEWGIAELQSQVDYYTTTADGAYSMILQDREITSRGEKVYTPESYGLLKIDW